MRRVVVLTSLALALQLLSHVEATDRWPQFRGAGAGVADDDPALPDTWSETENVVWKIEIPGQSWSSPIVWGDHVFLTSAISSEEEPSPTRGLDDPTAENGRMRSSASHRWVVYDIDFNTGKVRWEREIRNGSPPIARHTRNSYASETPVTDGERVYAYFGTLGVIAALDLKGDVVWTKDLGARESAQGWGMAASPLLHNGRVYVLSDNRVESFIRLRRQDRRRDLESEARRVRRVVDTGRLGERGTHGDCDGCCGTCQVVQRRWTAAVGAFGHVGLRQHPYPCRLTRPRLHQLRLSRQRAPTRVCHSSRREWRHLAQAR